MLTEWSTTYADEEQADCYYRARYYDSMLGRFLTEDPLRFAAGLDFFTYADNAPVLASDPTGLIHQAWNEPPFDGRLHDDPGSGLESLCNNKATLARDIEWLELSLTVRWDEIMKLGKKADKGHVTRHLLELDTLNRCKQECEKERKPEGGREWDEITDWLRDRWSEFSYAISHPRPSSSPVPPPPVWPWTWAPL